MKSMKIAKAISYVSDILLAVLYLLFVLTVCCMFDVLPIYSADQTYLIYMAVLWLPLCVVTLVRVIMLVITHSWNKGIVTLACLNAVYIPAIFLCGYIFDMTETSLRVIGIFAVITMILYFLLSFRKFRLAKN